MLQTRETAPHHSHLHHSSRPAPSCLLPTLTASRTDVCTPSESNTMPHDVGNCHTGYGGAGHVEGSGRWGKKLGVSVSVSTSAATGAVDEFE